MNMQEVRGLFLGVGVVCLTFVMAAMLSVRTEGLVSTFPMVSVSLNGSMMDILSWAGGVSLVIGAILTALRMRFIPLLVIGVACLTVAFLFPLLLTDELRIGLYIAGGVGMLAALYLGIREHRFALVERAPDRPPVDEPVRH